MEMLSDASSTLATFTKKMRRHPFGWRFYFFGETLGKENSRPERVLGERISPDQSISLLNYEY